MISERQMSKYQTETDSPVTGFNIKVRLWKYNGAQSLFLYCLAPYAVIYIGAK